MRQITARQRQIVLLLLDRREGMTAAEIAAEVGVSVRTIHREMEEIEKKLDAYGLYVYKKSGTGIWIEGADDEEIATFRNRLLSDKPSDFSGEERGVFVLCNLLDAEEPVKLFALAHSLKVTEATISNDLDELELWVKRFNLELIRRRGYGVEIEGEEANKRNAIGQLAIEHLDYSNLVGKNETYQSNPVVARLLAMISKSVLLDVEKTLWDMDWARTSELNEAAYTHLLIDLSVTVRRIRQGLRIKAGSMHARYPASEEIRVFTGRLEAKLQISFTEDEIRYVTSLFDRAAAASAHSELVLTDMEMAENVRKLIERLMKLTGMPFPEDRSLREGLLEHMGAAMKRIREGARIRNPLLGAIRKDYEVLFRMVRESVDMIIRDLDVPDEEIGFLVMHFGASIERLQQLSRNVRAILVCSSGLSSSRLLGIRLAKEVPQIEVLGNVSWYEATRLSASDYDLIISTINLPLAEDQYVKLSPLLTSEDIEKLLKYIQNTILTPKTSEADSTMRELAEARTAPSMESLRIRAALMNEIVSLLDRFQLNDVDNDGSLEGVLKQMIGIVSRNGGVSDPETVIARLLERERMGSQLIPDTSLALFHTRSRLIPQPLLHLFRLRNAVSLADEARASAILLMLAPKELPRESLEVLSEISAMLLRTELIDLMDRGAEEEIRSYLAEELQHYFHIHLPMTH